ncbi:Fructosamine-3-kinase [Hartmannibacter diazotrophicus]|uniref:Fructosamine-3-kinase n=1 Tax=Hartmannibacter diazotrophicus TaxID=1482074 RepID=A0A2C9D9F9_9HYPH|nr:fructosamine kinase family protein [Hartmannibacter diazotrophicus]SON56906.1 Fructosamine-3-kinase [Hartmannibacter diazotrophicus]
MARFDDFELLSGLVGAAPVRRTRMAGGDLSLVERVELQDGRSVILKHGPQVQREAAMLRAIAQSGAPAPEVLGVAGDLLVMEALASDGSLGSAWGALGAAVRLLHDVPGDAYGWESDHAFGPVPIENGWSETWPEFWAERRLRVFLAHVPADLGRRIERLCNSLGVRLPERPKASLLHGDLWTGNVLVAGGQVTGLIDPACYFGHSEVDLAMLCLFGSPSPAFYSAYGPLEPGYRERQAVYSLWPALVHLRLFGGGYRPMVERFLSDCGV